ncbi:hypothetical protein DPMN_111816 [Dreissena polymorpha]|uniref:Uncharacterized protein n=1 Tax=Dreissena polymorpha TaxID=45954 RepID=A0A9D4KFN3_DREPO|nr:hypothetical protein DPMN_111816 [Dreissena polymorpha]
MDSPIALSTSSVKLPHCSSALVQYWQPQQSKSRGLIPVIYDGQGDSGEAIREGHLHLHAETLTYAVPPCGIVPGPPAI